MIEPVAVVTAVRLSPLNLTSTVSATPLFSYVVSPLMVISTVAVFSPAAKVIVPELAIKSSPAVAVPVVNVS